LQALGLNIFSMWAPHFFVSTAYFGWIPLLKYARYVCLFVVCMISQRQIM